MKYSVSTLHNYVGNNYHTPDKKYNIVLYASKDYCEITEYGTVNTFDVVSRQSSLELCVDYLNNIEIIEEYWNKHNNYGVAPINAFIKHNYSIIEIVELYRYSDGGYSFTIKSNGNQGTMYLENIDNILLNKIIGVIS